MGKKNSRKAAETQRLRKENLKKLCDFFAASRLCVRFFFSRFWLVQVGKEVIVHLSFRLDPPAGGGMPESL